MILQTVEAGRGRASIERAHVSRRRSGLALARED